MTSPTNSELVRLRGFPLGVNNVAPTNDLPINPETGAETSLTEAVNVDLVGPRKLPRRRDGYTLKQEGRAHSLAALSSSMFAVIDDDLLAFNRDMSPTVLRAGVGSQYLSYAEVNGDMYWSSPFEFRRIRGDDLADTPGWIGTPGTPNAAAHPEGGMAAGTYQVAMTWLDAEGREGGAVGLAVVDVAEGEGIRVYDIPAAPEGAVVARVYVSPADGADGVLYAAADLSPWVTQTLLTAGAGQDGKALETLWRQPLPPCSILRFWNGRLLGATGNLLIWSDALRFGLVGNDSYMRFGQRITMLEPLGDGDGNAGVFIADHARVYWLAGGDPKSWRRVVRYDSAAVPGTSLVVERADLGLDGAGRAVFFLATDGTFCAGLPGGEIVSLTSGRLALPDGEQGASLFREHDGLRQLMTSYLTAGGNGLAIRERANATVTRFTTP